MADAVAGADIGSAEIEIVEPQRIRVVSIFHTFSPKQSFLRLVLFGKRRSIIPRAGTSISDNKQLPGSTDTAASFEFTKEDHTLGNALRYIIMKK